MTYIMVQLYWIAPII